MIVFQQSLFPQIDDLPILPFPGNKRRYLHLFLGTASYDTLISPFLGSGALELASNAMQKIVADADPALYRQWRYILAGQWGLVLSLVRIHQKRVADLLCTPGYAAYAALPAGKRRVYVVNDKLALVFMEKMDELWADLVACESLPPGLQSAAAALAIRKLGFMSIIREGKAGDRLNIKWSIDKLPSFVHFTGIQPVVKGEWRLHNDCFEAIAAFKKSEAKDAIAIVDPPYWLPWVAGVRNQMTPAYRAHKPHADETFDLCVEALRQVAKYPSVKRIVYCNYFSEQMDEAVDEVAGDRWKLKRKPLKQLAKGRLDFAWILNR